MISFLWCVANLNSIYNDVMDFQQNRSLHRIGKVSKVLAYLWALCFILLARHSFRVSQKRCQQFHISFRSLFHVLVFEAFQIIPDRSIVMNKLFLVHIFELRHLRKLIIRFHKKVKFCQPNENHLVTANTSKNTIRGTWLDVSFSLHVGKAIRAICYYCTRVKSTLFRVYTERLRRAAEKEIQTR